MKNRDTINTGSVDYERQQTCPSIVIKIRDQKNIFLFHLIFEIDGLAEKQSEPFLSSSFAIPFGTNRCFRSDPEWIPQNLELTGAELLITRALFVPRYWNDF